MTDNKKPVVPEHVADDLIDDDLPIEQVRAIEPSAKAEVIDEPVTEATETVAPQGTDDIIGDEDINIDDRAFTPTNKGTKYTEELPIASPVEDPEAVMKSNQYIALVREGLDSLGQAVRQFADILSDTMDAEEDLQRKVIDEKRPLKVEEGNHWARVFGMAEANAHESGGTDLTRDDSDWRQVIHHEGKKLRLGQPRLRNDNLTPTEMNQYIKMRSGLGVPIDVPLYHSGIWLRFTSPSNATLAKLQFEIGTNKIGIGMSSKGLAFSNTAQTITSIAVEEALHHVIGANVNYVSVTDLKEKISQLDIPALLWGFACTFYPNGFEFVHPCVADLSKCQHRVVERLNLIRTYWVDDSRLSRRQRSHMARKFEIVTDEELEAYNKDFSSGVTRQVWISDDIGLQLSIPSIYDYDVAGREWIDGMISMSKDIFNEPPEGSNRRRMIETLAADTQARQYSHWVSGIMIRSDDPDKDDMVVTTKENIDVTLSDVFSDTKYSTKFIESVLEFIADKKLTVVAVPAYTCPSCNSKIATEFNKRMPHLVELDVVRHFFTLSGHKRS